MIEITRKAPPPLAQEDYEHLKSLQWNNPATMRLRQAIGDDKLAIAWDPKAGCCLLARSHPVLVNWKGKPQGFVECYRPWAFWLELCFGGGDVALSMNDPRLVDYVRKCDLWSAHNEFQHLDENDAAKQARREKEDADDLRDHLKEDESKFKQMVEATGFVRHRDTGNDARTISSAAIWREGASKL